jgi:hypothetical protein
VGSELAACSPATPSTPSTCSPTWPAGPRCSPAPPPGSTTSRSRTAPPPARDGRRLPRHLSATPVVRGSPGTASPRRPLGRERHRAVHELGRPVGVTPDAGGGARIEARATFEPRVGGLRPASSSACAGRPGGGADPPVTIADARSSLELLTALYTSAATRSEVVLPLAPDHPAVRGWAP